MEKSEWNKFFITWMLGLFPQWKPDAGVSAAWYEQLQGYTIPEIKTAVRAAMVKSPSPFPPGVFEIIAVLESKMRDVELQAATAWERVRQCAKGLLPWATLASEDPGACRAVKLIGGLNEIGMCPDEKRPFLERRFLELYQKIDAEAVGERVVAIERYTGPEKLGAIMPKLVKQTEPKGNHDK